VYQFFPFGAGVWKCVGAQFADYEMRVVLARLVARFDFALEAPEVKPVQRGFTVAPSDGLLVRVYHRTPDWKPAQVAPSGVTAARVDR
jgi:cytochrome P450